MSGQAHASHGSFRRRLAALTRKEFRQLLRDPKLLMTSAGVLAVLAGGVWYVNRAKPEEARAERITAGGKTVELR